MASVLDPSAVTDLLAGYFVWSSEDDRAYIVTASGAIPLVGDRALTTLTDAALSPMGPDGLVRINGVLVPELPGSPITVGDSRMVGGEVTRTSPTTAVAFGQIGGASPKTFDIALTGGDMDASGLTLKIEVWTETAGSIVRSFVHIAGQKAGMRPAGVF